MREWRRVTGVGPRFNRVGLECMSGVDGAAARSAPACGFEILQRAGSLLVGRAAGGGSSLFYAGGISPLGRVDSRGWTMANALHPSFVSSSTREHCLPRCKNALGVVRRSYDL